MKQPRDHYYLFVHQIFPKTLWVGDSLFGILAVPDNQEFILNMWTNVGQNLPVHQRLPGYGIKHSSHWIGGEHLVFLITLPPATEPLEAPLIALTTSPTVRYFTLEKGSGRDFLLCEWTETENHLNYGEVAESDETGFLRAICQRLSVAETIEAPTYQQMQGMRRGPAVIDMTMPQELPEPEHGRVLGWTKEAEAAHRMGHAQQAERLYRQVLELRMKEQGPENTIATLAHGDLVRTLMTQKRYQEAEDICRKWWWYCRRYRMLGHAETMSATRLLAACLAASGKESEAKELLAYRVLLGGLARGKDSLVAKQARSEVDLPPVLAPVLAPRPARGSRIIADSREKAASGAKAAFSTKDLRIEYNVDDDDPSIRASDAFLEILLDNKLNLYLILIPLIIIFQYEHLQFGVYISLEYAISIGLFLAIFVISVKYNSWKLAVLGSVLAFCYAANIWMLDSAGDLDTLFTIGRALYFVIIFFFLQRAAKMIYHAININVYHARSRFILSRLPLDIQRAIPQDLLAQGNPDDSFGSEIVEMIWGFSVAGAIIGHALLSIGIIERHSWKWVGIAYSASWFVSLILIILAMNKVILNQEFKTEVRKNFTNPIVGAVKSSGSLLKKANKAIYRFRWLFAFAGAFLLSFSIMSLRNEVNSKYIFEVYLNGPKDVKSTNSIETYIANIREIVLDEIAGRYSNKLYKSWDDACFLLAKRAAGALVSYRKGMLNNCKEVQPFHIEEANFLNAANSINLLEDFVREYPEGAFTKEATKQIEEIHKKQMADYLSKLSINNDNDDTFQNFMDKFLSKRKINVYFTFPNSEYLSKIKENLEPIYKPNEKIISMIETISERKIVPFEVEFVSHLQGEFDKNTAKDFVHVSLLNHIDWNYPSNPVSFLDSTIIIDYKIQPIDKIKKGESLFFISMRLVFYVYLMLPDGSEPLSFTFSADPGFDEADVIQRSFEELSRALDAVFFSRQSLIEIDHFGPINSRNDLTAIDLYTAINRASGEIEKCKEKTKIEVIFTWDVVMDGHVENVKLDPKFQKGKFVKQLKCLENVVQNLKFPQHNKPIVNMFYKF